MAGAGFLAKLSLLTTGSVCLFGSPDESIWAPRSLTDRRFKLSFVRKGNHRTRLRATVRVGNGFFFGLDLRSVSEKPVKTDRFYSGPGTAAILLAEISR